MPRIAIITDTPFWLGRNGSQARIASLCRALRGAGAEVRVGYVGPPDTAFHAPNDTVEREGVAVTRLARDTRTRVRGWRLPDFECEAVRRSVASWLEAVSPRAVVVEFIRLAYTVDPAWARAQGATLIIDTHDAQHLRARRLEAAGHEPWLRIDADEEAEALRRFDLIVAIQPIEAEVFRAICPKAPVIVVPHGVEIPECPVPAPFPDGRPVHLGFVGSANEPNADAIGWFVGSCWPLVRTRINAELHVGGGVCEALAEAPGVRPLGSIDDLAAFYRSIDIAICPMRFGSGLKIKCVEALAHAKPLVTTPPGAEGMEHGVGSAFLVAATADDFADAIARIARSQDLFRHLSASGRRFAQHGYADAPAFRTLIERLAPTPSEAAA